MFKKFTEQEIRASIIPFNHLFLTEEQYEEFKKKSRPHVSNEDYTIIQVPLPEPKDQQEIKSDAS